MEAFQALRKDLFVGNSVTKNYRWYQKVTSFIFVVGFSYGAQIAASVYSRYVITQLERRYGASSKLAGNISQSYAAGATLCLIGLTFFAHKVKHRPRTTAYFIWLVGFGAVLAPMAHYFGGQYNPEVVSSKGTGGSKVQLLCNANRTMPVCDKSDSVANTFETSSSMLKFMYAAEFFMGFGVSAMLPLSYSYIDDSSEPGKSSFYFSAISTMFMFGPLISSILSAYIVRVYVDWPVLQGWTGLNYESHNWVGAWWVGYIVWSIWIFVSTIPYFFFPAKLPPQYELSEEQNKALKEAKIEEKSPVEKKKGIQQYIDNVLAVFHNYCFMSIVIHSIFEAYIGQGNMLFGKYLEREFDISPSAANLLGSWRLFIVMPAILFGGIVSSYFFKWNAQSAKKWIIAVQVLILLIESSYVIVGCENSNLMGWMDGYKENYDTTEINGLCHCKEGKLDKVCPNDDRNLMYLTACQAQCTDYQCVDPKNEHEKEILDSHGCWKNATEKDIVYKNCHGDLEMSKSYCKSPKEANKCNGNENYLVLLTTISGLIQPFLSGATTMVQFGSCPPEEKVTSMAIYKLSNKLLGSLWAAKVIGWVVDQTCVVWAKDDCQNPGHCLVYDRWTYKWYYFGYIWTLSAVSLVVYSGMIFFKPKKGSNAYKAITEQ